MLLRSLALSCLISASLIANRSVFAEDWPQILGPARNGVSSEKLPDRFPSGGPKVVWSAPVGQGYAGPAVASGKVIVFHRVDSKERVAAIDAKTGDSVWTTDFPASYRGGVNEDKGPRCVPLIHKDRVYLYGAGGDCHCVNLNDGKKVWSRALADDYEALDSYFGAGSTPIVLGDKLLVNVGGRKSGIVGLDIATGESAWQATDEAASYSSPAALDRGDRSAALFITRLNALEIDPANGKSIKLFKFGQTGPTVNAAIPLVIGTQVFATASYGVGAVLADVKTGKAATIWANDKTLSSQYSTPVIRDGYLYGIHGREDVPPAHLRCVELKSGKVMWSQDDFGVAHPIVAVDKLLLLTIEGELILAAASPQAYRELGRATIAKGTTLALPALANGHFYCRSKDKLLCVKLGD